MIQHYDVFINIFKMLHPYCFIYKTVLLYDQSLKILKVLSSTFGGRYPYWKYLNILENIIKVYLYLASFFILFIT